MNKTRDGGGGGVLEQLQQCAAQLRDLVTGYADSAGWSLSLAEARAFTDVFVGLRQIGEAGYLHAVQVQDAKERLAAPARRGRNATADALVLAYRIDPAQAVRDLAAARALDADTGALPALAAALLDGRVNRGHVDVAVGVVQAVPATVLRAVVDQDGQPAPNRTEPVGERVWGRPGRRWWRRSCSSRPGRSRRGCWPMPGGSCSPGSTRPPPTAGIQGWTPAAG